MSEPFLTNIRECKGCLDLFMVMSSEPMRAPGRYPWGTCRPCAQHEHEGLPAPEETDEEPEEAEAE